MKPRRVTLTLEVKTDAPLNVLRSLDVYIGMMELEDDDNYYSVHVLQVQANVVKPLKEGKKTL